MTMIAAEAYQEILRERVREQGGSRIIKNEYGNLAVRTTAAEEQWNLPAKTHVFSYQEHLSDNPEIFRIIAQEVKKGKSTIKLVAPCGSGKTYGILENLQEELQGSHIIVLGLPVKVLTLQTRRYSKNKVIIGKGSCEGDNDLDYSTNKANSMVYDKLAYLNSAQFRRAHENFEEIYAKMVLVIDEAHNLYDAKDYRSSCIKAIRDLARIIIAYGGSVIYMTGTPRKLDGFHTTCNIWCTRKDQNGNPVREINVNQILLHRIKGKESLNEYVIGEIRRYILEGYRPMVRINDKNRIRIIKAELEQMGFRVQSLSAEDKGFYTVREDGRKTGPVQLRYDSDFYAKVLNRASLPDADCYLVTSVLEEGTSIRYIEGTKRYTEKEVTYHSVSEEEMDKVFENKKLLPIYVALNPKEMDTDHIRQFFARPRFDVEKGIILTRYIEDKFNEKHAFPDESTFITNYFEEALKKEHLLQNTSTDRFDGISILGEKETAFLLKSENGWTVDTESVIAEGYKKYDQQIYYQPQYAVEMLKQIFAVPVTEEIITEEIISGCKGAEIIVNEETVNLFKETFRKEPDLCKWITKIPTIDDNDTTKYLRKLPDGPQLLFALRYVLADCSYNAEESVDLAVLYLQKGKKARVVSRIQPDGRKVNLAREIADSIFFQMSEWKNHCDIMRYLIKEMKARNLLNEEDIVLFSDGGSCLEERQLYLLSILKSTSYFEPFLRMVKANNGSNVWGEVCLFACMHSVEECELYIKAHLYTKWNRMDCDNYAYQQTVLKNDFASGAEYDILRNAQKHFFLIEPKLDGSFQWKLDATGNKIPMFPKGLIHKTLREKDFEYMAIQMPKLMKNQLKRQKYRSRVYTANEIEELIRIIYTTADPKCALITKGKKQKAVGLLVRSLRKKGVGTSYKNTMTRAELLENLKGTLYYNEHYWNEMTQSYENITYFAVSEQEMKGRIGDTVENLCANLVNEDAAKMIRNEITEGIKQGENALTIRNIDFLIHSAQINDRNGLPVSLKDYYELPSMDPFQVNEMLLYEYFESCGKKPLNFEEYEYLKEMTLSTGRTFTVRELLKIAEPLPWKDQPVPLDRFDVMQAVQADSGTRAYEEANPAWEDPEWADHELQKEAEESWEEEKQFLLETYGPNWMEYANPETVEKVS
ncbi:MAG: DEAD/DEAH box helicase family protein [Lachnospiraceae bacterium]